VPRKTWTLQGKTVLITGAARGIGAASARSLVRRGANVALVGLEPEELERVSAELGEKAAAFEADVTDVDALEQAVEAAVEHFGRIDAVVANAGVAPMGMTRSMDPAAFERTIEINLLGVWRTVRACLPQVIENQGYVLVIASMAAAIHGAGMAAYSASKAGTEAFGNSLRQELAHLDVDVGVGYFSWIGTDMVAGADSHPASGQVRAELPSLLGKTYPVEQAGEGVARGIESRGRTVVVPGWAKVLLLLRGLIVPLIDGGSRKPAADMDARFAEDVERRGEAEASAPVGAGGEAARERAVNRT
jgi:NAD(P)-dependent dehydrogenase (short-subunit alcohol dehydrogenase family)